MPAMTYRCALISCQWAKLLADGPSGTEEGDVNSLEAAVHGHREQKISAVMRSVDPGLQLV